MGRKYHKKLQVIETHGDLFARFDYAEEQEVLERLVPKKRSDCAGARAAVYADLPDDHATKIAAPCPWMRCRYHLHLDVDPVVLDGNDADMVTHHVEAPYEHTCLLDIVDSINARPAFGPVANDDVVEGDEDDDDEVPPKVETNEGNMTDGAIGQILNVSDELVRQIWNKAIERMSAQRRLKEYADD